MLMAACSARSPHRTATRGAADRAPFTLKVAHFGAAAGPPSEQGRVTGEKVASGEGYVTSEGLSTASQKNLAKSPTPVPKPARKNTGAGRSTRKPPVSRRGTVLSRSVTATQDRRSRRWRASARRRRDGPVRSEQRDEFAG